MTLSNFNWHSAEWRTIKDKLTKQRLDLIEKLIRADDAETRGKIKQIDAVLGWEFEEEVKTETTIY